jgi:hypothetical protein
VYQNRDASPFLSSSRPIPTSEISRHFSIFRKTFATGGFGTALALSPQQTVSQWVAKKPYRAKTPSTQRNPFLLRTWRLCTFARDTVFRCLFYPDFRTNPELGTAELLDNPWPGVK